ncbi:MAG: hypothetical protein HY904_11510 [Deltaproteobacteria bacterium]|nr:hypothetical protein [Deltaproteobacteria bacterium]
MERCNNDTDCGRGKGCQDGVCAARAPGSSSGSVSVSSSTVDSTSWGGGSTAGPSSASAAGSGASSSGAASSSGPLPLGISPASGTARLGGSIRFQGTGGVPPYSYALSGPGRLDADGTYRRTWTAGPATVTASDAAGGTASATLALPADSLAGGTTADETGWDVKVLADGTVFVVGETAGTMPGATPHGGADYFVARFDPYGQLTWVAQDGTTGADTAAFLLVRGDSLLVVGHTAGTFTGQTSAGAHDVFLAVHRQTDGARTAVLQAGGDGEDFVLGASLLKGNTPQVCVTGAAGGSLGGQTNAGGGSDQFIMVLDVEGAPAVAWTALWGSGAYDAATGCVAGPTGTLVAGYTAGLMGAASQGLQDATLTRFTAPSANPTVVLQLGGAGPDRAFSLQQPATGDAFYLVGYTSSSDVMGETLHGTEDDCLVAALDSTFAVSWVRVLGTAARERCYTAIIDGAGNLVIGGHTAGTLVGHASAGGTDAYLHALDPVGATVWTVQAGSAQPDGVNGLAVNTDGDVFAVGDAQGAWDGHAATGQQDVFVFKVDHVSGARR